MENFKKEKKKRNPNRLMKVGKISLITKYDISGKVYIFCCNKDKYITLLISSHMKILQVVYLQLQNLVVHRETQSE